VRTIRAQLPTGRIVTVQSSGDHAVQPGSLVLGALAPEGPSRSSLPALVRDLFPGAFPELVDCTRPPLLNPNLEFGSCNGPTACEPFEGWAFWDKDPHGGPGVYFTLVSHRRPSSRSTTSNDISAWESQMSALSISADDYGVPYQEFFIVGRRGDHEWLDSPDYPTFVSWDRLIELCTPSLQDVQGSVPSIVLIDELISSARRILAMLAKDPRVLGAIDGRRFEEITAVLLSDLGFDVIELTRSGKDGGRDLVVRRKDPSRGALQTILVECKHWTSRKAVGIDFALHLLDLVSTEEANHGILLSTSGFTPKLVEMHATLDTQHLHLRNRGDFFRWLRVWERTFASPIFTALDPMDVLDLLS